MINFILYYKGISGSTNERAGQPVHAGVPEDIARQFEVRGRLRWSLESYTNKRITKRFLFFVYFTNWLLFFNKYLDKKDDTKLP